MLAAHSNEPAAPQAPRRRFRKLRIAWSVAWCVVAVLLGVLWAWSQYYEQFLYLPVTSNLCLGVGQIPGAIGFETADRADIPAWTTELEPVEKWEMVYGKLFTSRRWGKFYCGERGLTIPNWFLLVMASCLVIVPWVDKAGIRFSLRTLLIATTLVAAVLGLIVYFARG
jgi:hypothetical protein